MLMQSTGKRASRLSALSALFFLFAAVLWYGGFAVPALLATPAHAQTTSATASATTTATTTPAKPTCTMLRNVNNGSITITWSSKDATTAYITHAGSVALSGVINLVLPLSTATTYVGTFTGPGGTATCSVSAPAGSSSSGSGGSGSSGTTDTSNTTGTTGSTNTSSTGTSNTSSGAATNGLVPCGLSSDITVATACSLCDFVKLIQNIINFLLGISTVIAVALFAYAGVLFFTSNGNTESLSKAKSIFKDVFIGFIIALSGYFVVQTMLSVVLNQNFFSGAGGSWMSLGSCTDPRPRDKKISELFGALTSNNAGGTSGSGVTVGGGSSSSSGTPSPGTAGQVNLSCNTTYTPGINANPNGADAVSYGSQSACDVSARTAYTASNGRTDYTTLTVADYIKSCGQTPIDVALDSSLYTTNGGSIAPGTKITFQPTKQTVLTNYIASKWTAAGCSGTFDPNTVQFQACDTCPACAGSGQEHIDVATCASHDGSCSAYSDFPSNNSTCTQ